MSPSGPIYQKVCIDRVLTRDLTRRKRMLQAPRDHGLLVQMPSRLAIIGIKRWDNGRTLAVSFLDGEPEVHERVQQHALVWTEHANLGLEFGDFDDADIRISFLEPGSWSFIGTDAKAIDPPDPTMNLGWLDPETADDEYRRVVLHEFGHALGAVHEHSSPAGGINWNKEAVYDFYERPPNQWSREEIDLNLFTMYDEEVTQHTAFDRDSIMLYPVPAEFTTDGFEVGWNRDLSEKDKSFMATTYPR